MTGSINDSQFSMWRAIFAFANADEVVSDDEVIFLARILDIVPFSEDQREVLKRDLRTPPGIDETFAGISDQDDRATFFHYARMLAWCDGDFAVQEQEELARLQKLQIESADFGKMMETSMFSFEDEAQKNTALKEYAELTEKGMEGVLKSLAKKFETS